LGKILKQNTFCSISLLIRIVLITSVLQVCWYSHWPTFAWPDCSWESSILKQNLGIMARWIV